MKITVNEDMIFYCDSVIIAWERITGYIPLSLIIHVFMRFKLHDFSASILME